MLRKIIGLVILFNILSGCAAIRGAHGDAEVAKQTGTTQATVQDADTQISAQTITPPVQPRTPGQNATTNAAKMIAPLH